MQPVLENKDPNSQLLLGCADRTTYIRRQVSNLGSRKDNFPQLLQSHTRYGDAAISNVTRGVQKVLQVDMLD